MRLLLPVRYGVAQPGSGVANLVGDVEPNLSEAAGVAVVQLVGRVVLAEGREGVHRPHVQVGVVRVDADGCLEHRQGVLRVGCGGESHVGVDDVPAGGLEDGVQPGPGTSGGEVTGVGVNDGLPSDRRVGDGGGGVVDGGVESPQVRIQVRPVEAVPVVGVLEDVQPACGSDGAPQLAEGRVEPAVSV